MIGFSPQQVRQMSIWQFQAALDGYVEAHSQEDGKLSSSEVDDVWKWLQEKGGP